MSSLLYLRSTASKERRGLEIYVSLRDSGVPQFHRINSENRFNTLSRHGDL